MINQDVSGGIFLCSRFLVWSADPSCFSPSWYSAVPLPLVPILIPLPVTQPPHTVATLFYFSSMLLVSSHLSLEQPLLPNCQAWILHWNYWNFHFHTTSISSLLLILPSKASFLTSMAHTFFCHSCCLQKKLVHAFVISRLDYCISLYLGLFKNLFSTLQSVLNATAHLVAKALATQTSQILCLTPSTGFQFSTALNLNK